MEPRPSRPQLPHPPSAVLTPSIGGFGLSGDRDAASRGGWPRFRSSLSGCQAFPFAIIASVLPGPDPAPAGAHLRCSTRISRGCPRQFPVPRLETSPARPPGWQRAGEGKSDAPRHILLCSWRTLRVALDSMEGGGWSSFQAPLVNARPRLTGPLLLRPLQPRQINRECRAT